MQGICQPQFDERLARDTDASGFLINGFQQCQGKIHIHALYFAAGAPRARKLQVRAHVPPRIVQGIEAGGRQRAIPRGTALLLPGAPAGPR